MIIPSLCSSSIKGSFWTLNQEAQKKRERKKFSFVDFGGKEKGYKIVSLVNSLLWISLVIVWLALKADLKCQDSRTFDHLIVGQILVLI